MAPRIVLRHSHTHAGSRLVRAGRTVLGGALLAVAVLVGPVGVLVLAGYAAEAISRVTGDSLPGDPGVFDELPWPTSTLLAAGAAAALLLVVGTATGLRLLRSGRAIVLFLRRFRDAEAIGALSAAAAGTLGAHWRVVTLDDGHIAPLGAASSARRLLGVLRGLSRGVAVVAARAFPAGGAMFAAAAAVVGLRYLETGRWDVDLVTRNLPGSDAFLGVLPPPPGPLGWDVETLTYGLVFAGLVLFCLGAAGFVLMLAMFPLAGPALLASMASQAVDEADRSRRAVVSGPDDLSRITTAVVRGSRRVLAPRLVVLTVGEGWWRQSVRALAGVAAATVVDVSEPSENVLWEVEQLRAAQTRLVLVAHVPELEALLATAQGDPVAQRLVAMLDGEEVLGYTLTWRGRRMFARALRSTLLCRADVRSALAVPARGVCAS